MTHFWSSRRVLVTGGFGFLGANVVRKLMERGAREVFRFRSTDADLTRLSDVQGLLAEYRPDMVVHCAARVGGIGANMRRPAEFFYDNLMMGAQLLHESWKAGVGKFVGIGTICSYPKHLPIPFKEEDFWNGYPEETNAPYGLAKKALSVQAQAYRKQYDFNAITLLPVNLYGPGDHFDPEISHVIPALMKKCMDAIAEGRNEVTCWGDGSPTREFLYVEDAAEAIVLAAERYDSGEPVNIGAGFEISIRELAERIQRVTGFSGRLTWDPSQPGGQPRRLLDTSRAERAFGFKAATSLEEGLQKTYAWYAMNR